MLNFSTQLNDHTNEKQLSVTGTVTGKANSSGVSEIKVSTCPCDSDGVSHHKITSQYN